MAIQSLKSINTLTAATDLRQKFYEKASSGKEINRASDNPAGLAVALALTAEEKVLNVGSRNALDAQSATSIAEGAYKALGDIETRKAELAAQAANGTYSDAQRAALDNEYQALSEESARIQATTTFNGTNVLSASFTAQVGTDSSANSQIAVQTSSPGVAAASIATEAAARAALDATQSSISTISQKQGDLGAASARLDYAVQNNRQAAENVAAARSRIEDADFAAVSAGLASADVRVRSAAAVTKLGSDQEQLKVSLLKKA